MNLCTFQAFIREQTYLPADSDQAHIYRFIDLSVQSYNPSNYKGSLICVVDFGNISTQYTGLPYISIVTKHLILMTKRNRNIIQTAGLKNFFSLHLTFQKP